MVVLPGMLPNPSGNIAALYLKLETGIWPDIFIHYIHRKA